MAAEKKSILQTRFFYVVTIFAVSFGTVSFLWRYKEVGLGWLLIAFGIVWAFVVTAFAWELATRAQTLDARVKARTQELLESNQHLSTLIEQISVFHRISHDMNQSLDLRSIAETFVQRTATAFANVDSAWLWLHDTLAQPNTKQPQADGCAEESPLTLVAAAGNDMGRPGELAHPDTGNPLIEGTSSDYLLSLEQDLRQKAADWQWDWLQEAGVRSFARYRLRAGEEVIGVLGVFSRDRFTGEFLGHLQLSVNQLTVALEKARLLREYRKRARELAEANVQLRELDTMKDWFVSSVSHELRTPLTNIHSFGEILRNFEEVSPAERKEFAGIITDESQRLAALIENVLDVAKIASGTLELTLKPISAPALIERSCKLFAREAEKRGILLTQRVPPDLPLLCADEDNIIIVMNNLVGNALKFSPDNASVEVSAELLPAQSAVRIAVHDMGPGIPAADQQRIFDRFTQLGTLSTGKPRGTGLGLAICKEIVERLGGRIGVESEEGAGSTFYFELSTFREGASSGCKGPVPA